MLVGTQDEHVRESHLPGKRVLVAAAAETPCSVARAFGRSDCPVALGCSVSLAID